MARYKQCFLFSQTRRLAIYTYGIYTKTEQEGEMTECVFFANIASAAISITV